METDSALTVRQVAELLSVNEKTVHRLHSVASYWVQGGWGVEVPTDRHRPLDRRPEAGGSGSSSDRPQASRRDI